MPLPQTDTVWPPTEFADFYTATQENDAWYGGDTNTLATLYAGTQRHLSRPTQYAGGVVGAVARFFWGRPDPAGEHRTRLHVPVAADLATASADLLFSEAPRFLLSDTAPATLRTRVDDLVNTPEMHSTLLEAAEVAAALSGVFLRIVWDATTTDHAMVDVVHPDRAVPEWRWGRLNAVTFWEVLDTTNKNTTLRHLERHEPGRILHGLYQGETGQLGRPIPLADHPATAYLTDLVDADGAITTGVDDLAAAYIPNIRPTRRWRSVAHLAPYGRSDYEGIEPLMDALDEVYSSWMRDIRLAKARLIVPENMLDSRGRGKGLTFDDDREVFTGAPMGGKIADQGIEAQQFAIRHEEHRATAVDLLHALLRTAGYSPATFGDSTIATTNTATEIKARDKVSERTRDKKSRYWASALGPFIRTLVNIDATVFGGERLTDVVQVKFPENAQVDTLELAQTASQLRAAQAASTETLVRMLHPNWDAAEVDDEVAKVLAEAGTTVTDPVTFDRVDDVAPAAPSAGDDADELAKRPAGQD